MRNAPPNPENGLCEFCAAIDSDCYICGHRSNADAIEDHYANLIRKVYENMVESGLPTVAELTGSDPDFTGGLSTEEYIRSIRRG